jgi:REP element-mobilizing transposase RayT
MAVNPIVIAHHLIWTAYGWWLPNDPRGSGSKEIRQDLIAELGELHVGRKKIQPPGKVIGEFYERAGEALKYPLSTFNESARGEIAVAFAEVITRGRYTRYGCAIMPDHVHILIRKHKHDAEDIGERLKTQSRMRLCGMGYGSQDHPIWGCGNVWKVFLDHPDEVRRTIHYIEQNPVKIRLPIQKWAFVKAYDGWPLHPGHSPNSPYVQRLRGVGRYP